MIIYLKKAFLSLFKEVFNLKLSSKTFAYCFSINFDILLPHIAQFDNIIVLPLLVPETFEIILSAFFCTLNNKIVLFLYLNKLINIHFFVFLTFHHPNPFL